MKYWMIMISVLMSTALFAQSGGASDPEAVAIMKKVSAEYEQHAVIKVKFSMSIQIPDEENDLQEGSLWLKGEMYHLEMMGTKVTCDTKQVKTVLDEDPDDVMIQDYEPDEGGISPANLLHLWKNGFIAAKGEKKPGNLQTIELTPIDKDKAYSKVTMVVNTSKNTIQSATIFDKNGNLYVYKILEYNPSPNVDDGFFRI